MKIQAVSNDDPSVNISGAAQERQTEQTGAKVRRQGNVKSIFAGDLGIGIQNDPVSQKKKQAQNQALKIIGEAWDVDRRFDQSVAGYKDKIAELHRLRDENLHEVQIRDEWKEDLRQEYGVSEDSQEQKDLKLLEKEKNYEANYRQKSPITLTQEEQDRLAEIHERGLTEYQQRCMAIDGQQARFEGENYKLEQEEKAYNAAITSTKLERLKQHEMVKAQKKADIVMEAASREVVGMLTDEAKEYMDKKFEEQTEEAKEKAEEKAEQEEKADRLEEKKEQLEQRIDANREKRREQEENRKEAAERSREEEALLSGMMEAGAGGIGATTEAQSDIKNMLHKMNLLDEDIKGSIVEAKLEAYS